MVDSLLNSSSDNGLCRGPNIDAEERGLFHSRLRYIAGDSYSPTEEVMWHNGKFVRVGLDQRLVLRKVLSRSQEVTENEA